MVITLTPAGSVGLRFAAYGSNWSGICDIRQNSMEGWSANVWYKIELIGSISGDDRTITLKRDGTTLASAVVNTEIPQYQRMTFGCLTYSTATYDDFFDGDLKDAIMRVGTSTAPTDVNWFPHDLVQYNPFEVGNWSFRGNIVDAGFGTSKSAPATAHVVTLVGGANVDADGLNLDGTSDLATIPVNADFDWGSSNIGISFWMKEETDKAYEVYYHGPSGAGNNQIFVSVDEYAGCLSVSCYRGGVGYSFRMTVPFSPTASTWTHVEINRVNTDDNADAWRIFVNGTRQTTTLRNGAYGGTFYLPTGNIQLGSGPDGDMHGSIADLQIVKGTYLHDADFTPTVIGKLPYALQDFRVAKAGVAVSYSAPLRGLNPITGVCDFWLKGNWSSTADNELECYIGNDAADAPTEGVTWPEDWPADPTTADWPDDWAGAGLSEDAEDAINNLVTEPETYNEVGELEVNT